MAALLVKKVYDWLVLRRNSGALHVRYMRADGTELELKVDRAQDRAELMERARRFLEPDDDNA
ncbi:MAG: effector-associated constant component EACC1 [Pseudonocardiaceae bacterium]